MFQVHISVARTVDSVLIKGASMFQGHISSILYNSILIVQSSWTVFRLITTQLSIIRTDTHTCTSYTG